MSSEDRERPSERRTSTRFPRQVEGRGRTYSVVRGSRCSVGGGGDRVSLPRAAEATDSSWCPTGLCEPEDGRERRRIVRARRDESQRERDRERDREKGAARGTPCPRVLVSRLVSSAAITAEPLGDACNVARRDGSVIGCCRAREREPKRRRT